MKMLEPEAFLRELFDAALEAALPAHVVAQALPPAPQGKVIVLGAGKASAAMAAAVEQAWPDVDLSGLIVTRDGHGVPTERIEVVEAAHPVPDERGRDGAVRMLQLARDAGEGDLVLCLISGGASALASVPAPGLSFEQKQAINTALLESGAPIDEMNAVRKRLSAIKGGRLAAAIAPAKSLTLLISDVPGDSPAVIGSGPTVTDDADASVAFEIIDRYNIEIPPEIRDIMRDNSSLAQLPEGHEVRLIATPYRSLDAAASVARSRGITPVILGDCIEGEAREVARAFAGVAKTVSAHAQPAPAPTVLLSGGETTVTVRARGRGGRNSEFGLGLALALEGAPGIYAIACDTDGIDGSEDNAGVLVTPNTLERAHAAGVSPRQCLESNDAYSLFEATGELVVSGPTLTNVNDFRAILVMGYGWG
jgi:glycerate 2-kinase